MGHDIFLILRPLGPDEHIFDVGHVDSTYVSFNWSSMNLTVHHFHGRQGKVIAELITRELDRLERDEKVVPRMDLGIDGWGNFEVGASGISWYRYEQGDKRVIYEIHCRYACILKRFLDLAQEYPECYWYSDQCSGVRSIVPFFLDELAEHGIIPIVTDSGKKLFRALNPLTGASEVIATKKAALEMAEYENKEGWTLLASLLE